MLKINKLDAFDAFTRYLLSDADPSFSSLVLAGGDPVSHHSFLQASGERAEDTPNGVTEYTRSAHPTAMTSPDQVSCGSVVGTRSEARRVGAKAGADNSAHLYGNAGSDDRTTGDSGSLPTSKGDSRHHTKRPSEEPLNANSKGGARSDDGTVTRTEVPELVTSPGMVDPTQIQPAGINFIKEISSSSGLKSRTPKNSLNFFSNSGVCWRSAFLGRTATYLAELMRRTLAPLRKIVSRELEVFEFGRNSVHPQSFAIHDYMECGHVHTSLLWDIFDLLNAYTESPHVRAIRHRCQECLTLVQRKPVVSVAAVAKAA